MSTSFLVLVTFIFIPLVQAQSTCLCSTPAPGKVDCELLFDNGNGTCASSLGQCTACYCDSEGSLTCQIRTEQVLVFTGDGNACMRQAGSVVSCPTPSPSPSPSPVPAANSFNVMSRAHDAIRGGIVDTDNAIQNANTTEFEIYWINLSRSIKTHALFEDNGFFALMDEYFDNISTTSGLYDTHEEEEALFSAVESALSNHSNLQTLNATYQAWKAHHLSHLLQEQAILGPKVIELATLLGNDPVAIGNLFNTRILTPNFNGTELAWWATWNSMELSAHSTFTFLRMYVHGFQWAATPTQWNAILPTLQAQMTIYYPTYWSKLVLEFDVTSDGKVAEP